MNWLESILYGLVSGFAEFLPISSAAHQALLKMLFGAGENTGLQDLLSHLAILAVLLYSCRPILSGFNAQSRAVSRGKKISAGRSPDMRLVRSASVPLLLSFLLYNTVRSYANGTLLLGVFFLLNGIILFLPGRMLSGNKDARAMSGWDGMLIGLAASLGIVPGLSRVGAALSAATARGADKQHAMNWILVLSIPAMIVLVALDVFTLIAGGAGISSASSVLNCILSMLGAGCGGYFGIMLMRFLSVKTGFTGFAYYCWGAAMFSFVLYLTVV